MPFCYKFDATYQEFKDFLNTPIYKVYELAFKPTRTLIVYRKDNRPIYFVANTDVFPNERTHQVVKDLYNPVEQKEFEKLCFEISTYQTEGDISLCGGDDLNGQPSIVGNPN